MKYLMMVVLILSIASSAFGASTKAFQLKDDFGTERLYDCALQYYYYIPCPTSSWFWAYSGFNPGDIVGVIFDVGDQGTGGYPPCDPFTCQTLEAVRVLDFAGYGTVYPGLFTVEMDIWCPPCPLVNLYNSGPIETHFGWNYIELSSPLCLTPCFDGEDLSFVVTMTHTGTNGAYPAWGMDNVSSPLAEGCELHDTGCLPATYPRTFTHSGYFGNGDPCQYYPPLGFCDGGDTTQDCTQFGLIELAWRAYIICSGPSATEPSTWGNIKRIYR